MVMQDFHGLRTMIFHCVADSQPFSIVYKMVHGLNQAVFRTYNFENLAILDFSSIQLCFRTGLRCYTECKKLNYLCNRKSQISNVCNTLEGHCLQPMKVVHHHANSCFN